jgi:hypothetical protein
MASNLNPKTAGLTLTGMLLGAEQYPSTVQQGVAGNTGYNLYRPMRGHELPHGDAEGSFTTTSGTGIYNSGIVYFNAGVYDFQIRVNGTFTTVTANAGTIWLQAGGTVVSNYYVFAVAGGSTFIEKKEGITIAEGWHSMYVYAYIVSEDTVTVTSADTFFRQYA